MKTLVNTLGKILVDTLANTLRASRGTLPPSPETPYQPTAGLIGIIYISGSILVQVCGSLALCRNPRELGLQT